MCLNNKNYIIIYKYIIMDYTLWKNRSKNIYNFFNENIDRIYVANDLFPKIGNYLKNTIIKSYIMRRVIIFFISNI